MILAHDDASHLERLCHALRPHSIFVHVDKKAEGFPSGRIAELPGVTVIKPSINVYWADFSMCEATLLALETAKKAGPFDRYVWLSGGCYPVKPMSEMEVALSSTRELMTLTPIRPGSHLYSLIGRRWRMAPLVAHHALDVKLRALWNKVSKMIKRDLERETGMTPYFGNSWWALTDDCISMILEFVRLHPDFVRAYSSVYAVDEIFFHTIVGNSKFGSMAIPVEDHGALTNQITPLHLVCPIGDRTFGSQESEFAQVLATDKLFIRKVSTKRSGVLLDRIDRELLERQSASPAAS